MRVEECSSIDDLLVALDRDIEYPHRFPSRFILIHGLETWREVIKELGRRVGHTIRLSGLCRSQDVLPDVSHVSETLLMKRDISVMVLPVSELLRFHTFVIARIRPRGWNLNTLERHDTTSPSSILMICSHNSANMCIDTVLASFPLRGESLGVLQFI
jgi:hypothetical protein